MPLYVFDRTIAVLKSAVENARLWREDMLGAMKRLDDQARLAERHARGSSVEALIADERERSHAYGGRSVFGWEPASLFPAEVGCFRLRPHS